MKKIVLIYLISLFPLISFAQTLDTEAESDGNFQAGGVIGAVSINGVNYQQFAVRADVPIGKLGFGLDFQLLLDANGRVRKEDWDDFTDYLDKIYYIRWAKKGDPFYFKIGGLRYTSLGFGNIVNGYSNMVEYPNRKRWGMEMALTGEKFGAELIINDFKELFREKASMMMATRLNYKIAGKLTIGASFASDFNQYNGLLDTDEDGYPDMIDTYPFDKDWVTERDYLVGAGATPATIQNLIAIGELNPRTKEDVIDYQVNAAPVSIYGVDLSYPLIDKSKFKLDAYMQFSKIQDYGWGATLPGVRMQLGSYFTVSAEYRRTSEEFVYGFFNSTYELERAVFQEQALDGGGTQMVARTKAESLKNLKSAQNGYFVTLRVNVFNLAHIMASYQDLRGGDLPVKSLNGELALRENLIPGISVAKAYYKQNNVSTFEHWKTPSTIMGYIVGYKVGKAIMGVDYRITFQDIDGNGLIEGNDETITTLSFKTAVRF